MVGQRHQKVGLSRDACTSDLVNSDWVRSCISYEKRGNSSKIHEKGGTYTSVDFLSMGAIRDENIAGTKRIGCYHVCFYIFCRSGNKYRNPQNKYGNIYCWKRARSKYGGDTATGTGVDRNLKTPWITKKIHTKTNKPNELLTWLRNNMIRLST